MKQNRNFLKWILKIIFLYAFLTFIGTLTVNAQEREVTGIVTTEAGVTLPGASVLIKGTVTGTITDIDGKYSITVPDPDAILVFSFVGYTTQEIPVGSQSVIDMVLSETVEKLDEVVVIGYGSQSRATVTTSVSKVDGADLNVQPEGSALKTLVGKVAGLSVIQTSGMPGSTPTIFIRGGSSPVNMPLNSTTGYRAQSTNIPLYIVDGVVRSEINDLPVEDIESVDILKDAASTAIYGARASNGIVLITTKKGKKKPGTINFKYSREWGSSERYKQEFLPPEEEIYYARIGVSRCNKVNGWTADYDDFLDSNKWYGTGNDENSRFSLQYTDDVKAANGGILPPEYITITDPITGREISWIPEDWQDKVFEDTYANNYHLSFNGGSDAARYNVGLGHYSNDGVGKGSYYKRYSLSANGDFNVRDNLIVGANFLYQFTDEHFIWQVYRWYERAGRLPSTVRYYKPDGTLHPGNSGKPNPEYWLKNNVQGTYTNRISLSSFLEWDIIDGLKFRPFVAIYKRDFSSGAFAKASAYSTRRSASGKNTNYLDTQFDATLTYNKTLADVHGINAVVGASLNDNYMYEVSGSSYGASTDLIPTLNAAPDENDKVFSNLTKGKLQSYFGRVNYNFDKKYLLSASLRIDGASNFAENYKFGTFPGISLGWNLHNEDFFSGVPYVSRFKLRASYGETGNNNIGIEDTQGKYTAGYQYAGSAGLLNTKLPNYNLKWETTSSFDVGFDMGIFDNRINVLFDYYYKKSFDRLYNKNLPSFTGFSSIITNFGTYINEGFEFEISAKALEIQDFRWEIDANWGYNLGKVGKLPSSDKPKNRDGGFIHYDTDLGEYVWTGGYAEGERPDQMFAFVFDGVYVTTQDATEDNVLDLATKTRAPKVGGDTRWFDADQNDTIDNRDRQLMGYFLPKHRGGLTNRFQYKNLQVRIALDWAIGHTIYDYGRVRILSGCQGEDRYGIEIQNSWMNEGDITDYPRVTYADLNGHTNYDKGGGGNTGNNSFFMFKGDYIALREVYIGYNLPKKWLDPIHLSNLTAYFVGRNLGWIKKYPGRSPEIGGYDRYMYPVPLTLSFGLNVAF